MHVSKLESPEKHYCITQKVKRLCHECNLCSFWRLRPSGNETPASGFSENFESKSFTLVKKNKKKYFNAQLLDYVHILYSICAQCNEYFIHKHLKAAVIPVWGTHLFSFHSTLCLHVCPSCFRYCISRIKWMHHLLSMLLSAAEAWQSPFYWSQMCELRQTLKTWSIFWNIYLSGRKWRVHCSEPH